MSTFTEKMDRYLDEYCRLFRFSGILRVTQNDQVLYERCMGYADQTAKTPITPDSVFTLYSLSKPFCAIGLLKLVDQGLVDLDAHPGKYVPEAGKFDSRVTIRRLLHHISGLPDYGQFPKVVAQLEEDFDIPGSIRFLAAQPLNFEPGTSTLYANINFVLPARMIEEISGMAYADYMKQEVFAPLGMKTAAVDGQNVTIPNHVTGYDIDGGDMVPARRFVASLFGAGDIAGTVDDVYCLNQAIKHRKLLKPETWDMVLTPAEINNFGLGCSVSQWHGKQRITHNGGHSGFRTLHIQLPEDDFDIILLSNAGFGNSRATLSEAVYTAFYGDDSVRGKQQAMDAGYIQAIDGGAQTASEDLLPQQPARVPLTSEEEQQILGQYGSIRLEQYGEDYRIVYANGKSLCVYHAGDGALVNRFIDEGYRIQPAADGTLTLLGQKKN